MLKQTHISVSELAVSSLCLYNHIALPTTLCLMAGTYLGAQLPDIDHPKSKINRRSGLIGRFFRHHVHHRTWTHTLWAMILMIILATFSPAPIIVHPLIAYAWKVSILRLWYIGLALGYCLHVIEDSFSDLGVCWTYPLRKYNFYYGHPYKKGHKHFWNYRTGGKEEHVIYVLSNLGLIYVITMLILS